MLLLSFWVVLGIHVACTAALGWGWITARTRDPLLGKADLDDDAPLPPISVVIAVRNEATVLPSLLDALDAQTHPSAEIIFVDDASTDATASMLSDWASGNDDRRVVSIGAPEPPRKKTALTRGIEAARHDLLAFTDADCTPPPTWLAGLARAHAATSDATVFVGYSPFDRDASGLLGAVSRYETLVAGVYTAAAAGLGRPYMAVGRNLSYPRAVFDRAGGFDREQMSGDDDLFVQRVRRTRAAPVRALLDARTHVPTDAPPDWRSWIQQKRRHVSAGRAYPWDIGVVLSAMHLAAGLLWLAPGVLSLTGAGLTGAGLLAAGLLARHAVLAPASALLRDDDLLSGFPLWELAYLLYLAVLVPLGLLRPPTSWSTDTSA